MNVLSHEIRNINGHMFQISSSKIVLLISLFNILNGIILMSAIVVLRITTIIHISLLKYLLGIN